MSDYFAGWVASDAAKQDSINLKRIYIDINEGNLYDGVLFSQIMYWHEPKRGGGSRLRVEKDGHLWLAKRYEDWEEECRINAATARKCIARLVKRGLLIKKNYHFGGKPMVHLRINETGFENAVKAFLSVTTGHIEDDPICPDVSVPSVTTGHIDPILSVTTGQILVHTETTKDTETTKNKKKKDSAAAGGAPPPEPVPLYDKPAGCQTYHEAMCTTICEAFGWDWSTVTSSERGKVTKASKILRDAKVSVKLVPALYRECVNRLKGKPFTPRYLTDVVSDVRNAQTVKAAPPPGPTKIITLDAFRQVATQVGPEAVEEFDEWVKAMGE